MYMSLHNTCVYKKKKKDSTICACIQNAISKMWIIFKENYFKL